MSGLLSDRVMLVFQSVLIGPKPLIPLLLKKSYCQLDLLIEYLKERPERLEEIKEVGR